MNLRIGKKGLTITHTIQIFIDINDQKYLVVYHTEKNLKRCNFLKTSGVKLPLPFLKRSGEFVGEIDKMQKNFNRIVYFY